MNKRIYLLCCSILVVFALSACSTDNELSSVKKDLEAYKSQVDSLKVENENLKKEIESLKNSSTTDTSSDNIITIDSNSTDISNQENIQEEYKQAKIGDKIVFDNIAEVTIKKCEFSKKVLPPKPDGYYTYYEEKDEGKVYFHVIGEYKNLRTDDIELSDIPVQIEAKYQDKYDYSGFKVGEEDGGTDFDLFPYIAPLTTLKFHTLIEVPNEVKDGGKLDILINNGENKYLINVK